MNCLAGNIWADDNNDAVQTMLSALSGNAQSIVSTATGNAQHRSRRSCVRHKVYEETHSKLYLHKPAYFNYNCT